MRTAIILRFEASGAESLAYFPDTQRARDAFKAAAFDGGSLELWTSTKGLIKRKRFNKPVEIEPEVESVTVAEAPAEPEPAPIPAPVPEPVAEVAEQPKQSEPEKARGYGRKWRK